MQEIKAIHNAYAKITSHGNRNPRQWQEAGIPETQGLFLEPIDQLLVINFVNKEKEDSPEVLSYVLKAHGLGIPTRPERAAILPKAKSWGDNLRMNREKVSEETESITGEQLLSPKAGEA